MLIFDTSITGILVVAVCAYLAGSIPFGLVISRLFGLSDPRTVGSGNIGATNVLRSGSRIAALLTVLLDAAKGAVSVIVAREFVGDAAAQVAGLMAFFGHIFPMWLKFKGGKAVATSLGVLVGLSPIVGLIALGSWLFTYFVFRYSSLAAVMAAVMTPLVAFLLGFIELVVLLVIMALIVIWRHAANIGRLRDGTEPMVDWGKK